jgi:hypothetical protein
VEVPNDSAYSNVASLRSMIMVMFLAELNNLELCDGVIGNAYMEAYTGEEVEFIAGPELGPLEGHTLLIINALMLNSRSPRCASQKTHIHSSAP